MCLLYSLKYVCRNSSLETEEKRERETESERREKHLTNLEETILKFAFNS